MARALVAVGAALLLVGLVLGGMQAYQRYQAAVERQQVDAYTAALLPAANDAGRLVSQTIVPELHAYAAGQVPGAKIAADAVGWRQAFIRTRASFAKAPHSGRLDPIAKNFDTALGEYATAMAFYTRLGDAGAAPAALAAGDTAGLTADRTYGQAESALACLRRTLGLSAVTEFRVQSGVCPSA